jgi:hypothetical protein
VSATFEFAFEDTPLTVRASVDLQGFSVPPLLGSALPSSSPSEERAPGRAGARAVQVAAQRASDHRASASRAPDWRWKLPLGRSTKSGSAILFAVYDPPAGRRARRRRVRTLGL